MPVKSAFKSAKLNIQSASTKKKLSSKQLKVNAKNFTKGSTPKFLASKAKSSSFARIKKQNKNRSKDNAQNQRVKLIFKN